MMARVYVSFIFPIALIGILVSESFGAREKLFYSGTLLGGVMPLMWIDALAIFGLKIFRTMPTMLGVFCRSRRSGFILGPIVIALSYWLSPFSNDPSPYRYQMSAIACVCLAGLVLQPPFALVLGGSSLETIKVVSIVARRASLQRVVAFLDVNSWTTSNWSPFIDNLRTEENYDWKTMVKRLMDVSLLIVIDVRTDHSAVVWEVREAIAEPGLRNRTLFVVGAQDEAPALWAHGLDAKSPGLRVVRENVLDRV